MESSIVAHYYPAIGPNYPEPFIIWCFGFKLFSIMRFNFEWRPHFLDRFGETATKTSIEINR
jgi:hypothetical protein